ncbi:MFS family permease [Saccharopolyspora lacisalsi]|uniref:MFS family permease n=1 Tax=Halosaccharopolyspora lacisalsi TaxID=1000566 RepID=A0A839DZJ2_9PSEU|nr:MFS transporter [Halosaccharopolyspora lacisalsi]MBA8824641.1 MFS family permease [Halosaccharopolyspora lacisalsi]
MTTTVAERRHFGGEGVTWSPRRAWMIWGLAALCYFTALFHRASLAVAAPEALDRFSAGPAVLSLFSALQLGVYLALQIPSGVLADRLGPRTVITGGMLALAAGSTVFGLSTSLAGGITGRMLIGFGDAFLFTNVLRLAAHWFPANRFGRVAALTGLIGGLGQLVATTPLSAALHELGWVTTFVTAAALTAALAVLAAMMLRNRPAGESGAAAEGPPERIGRLLRSVVAQRGTQHSFWVHFVLMAQFVAVSTLWGSPWLIQAQGYSSAGAGTMLMLCVVAFLVGSWLSGRYLTGGAHRREKGTLWLSVAVAASWAVMIGWPGPLPFGVLLAVLVTIGVGGGGAMLAFDGARSANLAHRSGTASGVVNMGGFLAAVLIQAGVGGVLSALGQLPPQQAYRWAFVPVLVVIGGGVLGQLVRRTRPVPGS